MPSAPHPTKQRLLEAGLGMLLEHGYNDLGIAALLEATKIPKGSFYHHFTDKEDFALAVLDMYMDGVHGVLDGCLGDTSKRPLARVRFFFETVRGGYKEQGYLGCLIGGLGQELSGVNERFRKKIAGCMDTIANRLGGCLEQACVAGELPKGTDAKKMAHLLVDCWEGAALRSRLRGSPAPLNAMLDFYFAAAAGE